MLFHAIGMIIHFVGVTMRKFSALVIGCIVSAHAWALVDLNTATQAQLEGVNGIGPSKAKAIIDYRTKNGGFRAMDDLDKVPGFGKATLDKIRSELSVGGGRASAVQVPVKPAKK